MDIIYLHDLKIDAVIGIFDWERRVKQTITLGLDMAADIRTAAASDSIADTLDYKAVSKRLIDFVGHSEFHLVETIAERVAEIVLTEFNVAWVRVRVNKKGAVRGAMDVGVIIERGERP
ncbi:MAG: dihydroneopterin aldolase [Gammaproteobacteria bacterium]|nr:dihydroneopterin aldolase [Gammaproteobacteria bacterium]